MHRRQGPSSLFAPKIRTFRQVVLTNFGNSLTAYFLILSNFEKMGILNKFTKLKRNKTFGYSPRYYNDKGEGNPFKFEQKFDKFRSTVDTPRGLKNKVRNAAEDLRRKGDRNLKIRFLAILVILLFIFLYIIDFDLSIFYTK
jgi:hypothetical protein